MKKLILFIALNVQGQPQVLTQLDNIPPLLHTVLNEYLQECYTIGQV